MRQAGLVVVLGAALLAGCGRSEAKKERAYDAAAHAHHYEPPASLSRAEFGTEVVKRFHQLDRDGDGYLSPEEWPHSPERFRREDTNGDGKISADEFGQAALARFDARDTNHDGVVTAPEWYAWKAKQREQTAPH
jgi:hypothetical protein